MNKPRVIRDELLIDKKGGIYCFMPFDNIDEDKKAVFKIGITMGDFNDRVEGYHSYYPNGVYMIAFLIEPKPDSHTQGHNPIFKKKTYYTQIEKYIFQKLVDEGAYRIHSTTRVRNKNAKNQGATEWFYTDNKTIIKVFKEAHKEYNGELQTFQLEGRKINKKVFDINKHFEHLKETMKPHYVGNIFYALED